MKDGKEWFKRSVKQDKTQNLSHMIKKEISTTGAPGQKKAGYLWS